MSQGKGTEQAAGTSPVEPGGGRRPGSADRQRSCGPDPACSPRVWLLRPFSLHFCLGEAGLQEETKVRLQGQQGRGRTRSVRCHCKNGDPLPGQCNLSGATAPGNELEHALLLLPLRSGCRTVWHPWPFPPAVGPRWRSQASPHCVRARKTRRWSRLSVSRMQGNAASQRASPGQTHQQSREPTCAWHTGRLLAHGTEPERGGAVPGCGLGDSTVQGKPVSPTGYPLGKNCVLTPT